MAQTLGKQLARKREREGMSVEDVAHRTRIPANIVRSLENDDYSHFPNLVYARSFLRMYSAHLEVDAGAYLDELRQAVEAKPARNARSGPRYFRSQVTAAEAEEIARVHVSFAWFPWRTILSGLFFAVVLGAGSYVVYQLWSEHQQQKVAEASENSGGNASPSEESLIGEGGRSKGAVPEETMEASVPEPGLDSGFAEEDVVPRALPADIPPAEAEEGDADPGENTAEQPASPVREGPEVSSDEPVTAADAVAATGIQGAPSSTTKPADAPSPN